MSGTNIPFLASGIRAIISLNDALASKATIENLFAQQGWLASITEAQATAVREAFGLTDLLEDVENHLEELSYKRGNLG